MGLAGCPNRLKTLCVMVNKLYLSGINCVNMHRVNEDVRGKERAGGPEERKEEEKRGVTRRERDSRGTINIERHRRRQRH